MNLSQNKRIKFGKVDKVILFGGNEISIEICKFLKKKKINSIVFTTKSQSLEQIYHNKTKLSFLKCLKLLKINHKIVKSLNFKILKKHVSQNTIGLSNACRWIFQKSEIKLFNGKLFNIHFSNLPNNRGAGGLSWNIMMKNYTSGTTIHLIDEKIDHGYSLINKSFKFPKKIRESLYDMKKYSFEFQKKISGEFLVKILKNKTFNLKKIILSNSKSSYWPKLDTKKNAWINWQWSSEEIANFINAFSKPYSGAKTLLNNRIINLKSAKVSRSNFNFHPFQYGLIYKIINKKIFVASKNGGIILHIKDFDHHKKLIGKRLKTNSNLLEQSTN